MELEFLKTLLIIFGASAAVVFILHKLQVPSIVGFLVAGTLSFIFQPQMTYFWTHQSLIGKLDSIDEHMEVMR